MHRRKLVKALQVYLNRYPEEEATVDRFNELLSNNANCFERDCWAGNITG